MRIPWNRHDYRIGIIIRSAQFSREFHLEMCTMQASFCAVLLMALLLLLSTALQLPTYVEQHMNREASPCRDFYEHACGHWAQAHAGQPYRSQLEQLDYTYHDRLATLLVQTPRAEQPQFVQLLRDYYAACRKLEDRYGPEEFVRWLPRWGNISLDGEEEEHSAGNWLKLLHLLTSYGFSSHLDAQPQADDGNFSDFAWDEVFWLQQLQPPWPALAEEDVVAEGEENFLEFLPLTHGQFRSLYRALQPMGVPHQTLWQQVKQLEQQLLPARGDRETEEEEEEEEPQIGIPGRWLLPLPLERDTYQLRAGAWQQYLQRLPQILRQAPPSLLCRYLLVRLLHKLRQLPPPTFGRQECAAQTRHLLTHAAVWLLQQQQPQAERATTDATLQQLFEGLRQQFKLKLLANRNRFGVAAQRYLLDKLQLMRLRLGVLPPGAGLRQQLQLQLHYAGLQLNASDYYGNLQLTLRHIDAHTRLQMSMNSSSGFHLLLPDGFASYASPFFRPDLNQVLLPLSLLATPIYSPGQAAVLTQSALGFLMAHELSHGFGPSAVHYDAHGGMMRGRRKRRILQNKRFAWQHRCLRRRHGSMADEKFADFNGLQLAHEVFMMQSHAGNLTDRLFFLNFAQFFCRDEKQLRDSTVHGASRQRINEAVTSMESFGRAFGCAWQPWRCQKSCQLY